MPNDVIVKTLTPISESRLCVDPEFEKAAEQRAANSKLRTVKRETKIMNP